jgi:hypothetical protein
MNLKVAGVAVSVLAGLGLVTMTAGFNQAGYKTVVQTWSGSLFVKADPGMYLKWFGTATEYPDFLTFDFDQKTDNDDGRSITQQGIEVQYQEGGKGHVFGQVRFELPKDEKTMIELHKAYRSPTGIAYKLIKPSVEQVADLTAKLMTSDESYMEKSSIYNTWARDQLVKGVFRTKLEGRRVKADDVIGAPTTGTGDAGSDGTIWKEVPVIATDDAKNPIHESSDLDKYSVTLSTFQVTGRNYEQKTIDQIDKRREANMEIITAKANAERAKQDAITAEEVGKRNVKVAEYEKMVEKEKAVVDAEKAKEVATIAAKQKVSVAEQEKLEQEQKKLAAGEYKQAQTLRGEGDAAYKKAVLEADNALAQKLETYEKVMGTFATEFGKQKWVPDIQFGQQAGSSGTDQVNNANQLIDMLAVKTAKDLNLDMNIGKSNGQ